MSDSPADLIITGCTALVQDDQERIAFQENATIVVRGGVIESPNDRSPSRRQSAASRAHAANPRPTPH
jgi:5-methylthioadenosine/S-adenosylhomocysteine deaminase